MRISSSVIQGPSGSGRCLHQSGEREPSCCSCFVIQYLSLDDYSNINFSTPLFPWLEVELLSPRWDISLRLQGCAIEEGIKDMKEKAGSVRTLGTDVVAGPWGIQTVPVQWRKAAYHTVSLMGPFGLIYVLHTGFKRPAPWLDCHVPHKIYDSKLWPPGAPGLLGDRAREGGGVYSRRCQRHQRAWVDKQPEVLHPRSKGECRQEHAGVLRRGPPLGGSWCIAVPLETQSE